MGHMPFSLQSCLSVWLSKNLSNASHICPFTTYTEYLPNKGRYVHHYESHEKMKGNQFCPLGTLQNLRIQCECVILM